MKAIKSFARTTLAKCQQFNRAEEGTVSIESMMMIAVAAMILIGVTNIVGVGTDGSVTGGSDSWFGIVADFVPGLLGL